MSQIVHQFKIVRRIRGEYTEYDLSANFEITPAVPAINRARHTEPIEGGHAILVGNIFFVDSGLPWEGRLTSREKDHIESRAYNSWSESHSEEFGYSNNRDSCIVDPDFDDDMAIKIDGLGQVSW